MARRLGKRRIIAETGAGQHGVATAMACALFGLTCVVYMGEQDTVRDVREHASGVGALLDLAVEACAVDRDTDPRGEILPERGVVGVVRVRGADPPEGQHTERSSAAAQ